MKTAQQIDEHHPSDMIPMSDGMVIIFGKYELKVQLLDKEPRQINKEQEFASEKLR